MAKAKKKSKAKVKTKAKPKVKPKVKPQVKAKTKPTSKNKPKAKAKVASKKVATRKVAKKEITKKTPKKVAAKAVSKVPAKRAKPSSSSKEKLADLSGFVTPLDDRVLIRLAGVERKTAGGLFIPDTVSDVSGNLEGVIVSVGRGHRDAKGRLRPMDVRLGDRVVFPQYAGSKIRWRDEDLLILRESELMGVMD